MKQMKEFAASAHTRSFLAMLIEMRNYVRQGCTISVESAIDLTVVQ